jgi:hypothetical protein
MLEAGKLHEEVASRVELHASFTIRSWRSRHISPNLLSTLIELTLLAVCIPLHIVSPYWDAQLDNFAVFYSAQEIQYSGRNNLSHARSIFTHNNALGSEPEGLRYDSAVTASPPPVSRLSRICGSLNVSKPYGFSRSLTGRALLFLTYKQYAKKLERFYSNRGAEVAFLLLHQVTRNYEVLLTFGCSQNSLYFNSNFENMYSLQAYWL